jgi:hypothetical protein
MAVGGNIGLERLRSYSSAFSRHAFQDILLFDDFSHLDWLYQSEPSSSGYETYLDYLGKMYRALERGYRCEYVYKNEIIHHLIRKYRSKTSVIFNEFRVGTSVADLAFFNGESKAFEIKTEFDSDKRLLKQMADYCRLFDKCYLVIPEEEYDHYSSIVVDQVGIILLSYQGSRIVLDVKREALQNSSIDVDLLMGCCRTSEYETFIVRHFGALPHVPVGQMYRACCELMRSLPEDVLKRFFIASAKSRKADLVELRPLPKYLRQMCLSLNLGQKQTASLINKLNVVIG